MSDDHLKDLDKVFKDGIGIGVCITLGLLYVIALVLFLTL